LSNDLLEGKLCFPSPDSGISEETPAP
jgi:hypothetical protein